jgi:hypothetical protein
VSGDGLVRFSRLIAAGLASADQKANNNWLIVSYAINISEKGKQIIEAWKSGDRLRLKQTLGGSVPGLGAASRTFVAAWKSVRPPPMMAHRKPLGMPSEPDNHATRSLAIDPGLDLPFTVISMSRPSTNRSRIRRSIENPESFPCLSAETLG